MDFREYLLEQKLNDTTFKNHMRNMDRFGELSDRPIITQIEACCDTTSKRMSMASTISKFLKFKELPNEEITKYIKTTLEQFQKEKDKKMAELVLPTLTDIKEEMNKLYEKEDWRSYVILFLLVQYQCRNMDLIAKVVQSKRDTNDDENWFITTPSQVKWIRNKYKTSEVYGCKTHVIKHKKFMNAISQLQYVLAPSDNIDRVIKKATANLGFITEGTIAKIVLAENNTMNGVKKVSKNRGTSTGKLIESYNIT
jgi:hypothetical protein